MRHLRADRRARPLVAVVRLFPTILTLAVLAVLAALPAGASASTASVVVADSCAGDTACTKYGAGTPVPVTVLAGEPGEANRMTASRDGGEFVLRDDGAPLRATAPCRQVDERTARCPVTAGLPAIRGLSVLAGDGDDAVAVAGDLLVETRIDGGPGADTVSGSAGDEQIDGGQGDDRLDGGAGADELVYASRSAPVTADLAVGSGGEAGERDALAGFETLLGGSGADELRGAAAAEVIDGGAGPDTVRAGGGDDTVFGDRGSDRLAGGSGNDRLFGDPAQGDGVYTPIIRMGADRLSGGRGDDELYDAGGRNVMLGGAGDDLLEGGPRPDRLDAGAGRDRVWSRRGGRDRVRCGAGLDRLAGDPLDEVRRGCERRWRTRT